MPAKTAKAKTVPQKKQDKIKTVTKSEFIASVARSQGVTKKTVYDAIKLFEVGVVEILKQKKTVRFNEFASFGVSYHHERKG